MNPSLPPRLKAAADQLLEGVSRKDLAARSAAISAQYRSGQGSAGVVLSEADTLAYLVARLPATYAVNTAVLAEVRGAVPDFTPQSLLDVGAGPGTATWAARETFASLNSVTLTDSNARFLALAEQLVPDAQFLAHNLVTDDLPKGDMVIASFVLAELAQPPIAKLYAATSDVLVLIEPGTPAGFERIRAARAQLIEQGANILAPCTHANACPVIAPDWCHFTQRLPRTRDHMQAKGANVPYEDERYAYIAVSKRHRSAHEGHARILAPPRETKPATEFKLCTPQGLEQRTVAKRDKEAFAAVRKAGWGDVLGPHHPHHGRA